jgi:hypothetical protein
MITRKVSLDPGDQILIAVSVDHFAAFAVDYLSHMLLHSLIEETLCPAGKLKTLAKPWCPARRREFSFADASRQRSKVDESKRRYPAVREDFSLFTSWRTGTDLRRAQN